MDPLAKKELGQHWLNDHRVLSSIVKLAEITTGDTVVEIGPGPGALTEQLLLSQAKSVIAIEVDRSLLDSLSRRFSNPKFTLIEADIRQYNLNLLPSGYKLVANIPYYLTSYLIRLLSQTANPPDRAVLLIQREVAERLTAAPGDLSLLSVMTGVFWQIELGRIVEASLFTPPPKVDSQVVVLKRRPTPLIPEAEQKQVFRTIKGGFSQKRKTLVNALAASSAMTKAQLIDLLQEFGLSPSIRAQELTIEQWRQISAKMVY